LSSIRLCRILPRWFDGFMTAEGADELAGSVLAWQLVESRVVHSTPSFEVRIDSVVGADGQLGRYPHVVAPASVTVFAIDKNDSVVLTRKWIYTHGGSQWQLPGGVLEQADAEPVTAARRELAETGLQASTWRELGAIYGADSLSNHVDHLFLATGLTGDPACQVHRMPFPQAVALVRAGGIPHAGSGYALLRVALDRAGRS
jgi:8-oxo-dGTP pyrophosphatase MutT (NUDIX family)